MKKNKKVQIKLWPILLILLVIVSLLFMTKGTSSVDLLKAEIQNKEAKEVVEIEIGQREQLEPRIESEEELIWSSSNRKVNVDQQGYITGVSVGDATITVKTKDGSILRSWQVICIRVDTNESKRYSVKYEYYSDNTVCKVTLEMESVDYKTLFGDNKIEGWESRSIGTVREISKEFYENTNEEIRTADDSVIRIVVDKIEKHIDSINFKEEVVELEIGQQYNLDYVITPADVENRRVSWSSSNEKVIEVNSYGKVTAVARGEATITVTTQDRNKTAECIVRCVDKDIVADRYTVTYLYSSDRSKCEVTIERIGGYPMSAIQPEGWNSIDEGTKLVKTFTENTREDLTQYFGTTVIINVDKILDRVREIYMVEESIRIAVGKSQKPTIQILPVDAANKNVTWTTSNNNIVSVNNEGIITGISEGTATITAKTEDGGKTASCEVTVLQMISDKDIVGPYEVIYEYYYTDNIVEQCEVTIRRTDGSGMNIPEGWNVAPGGGSMTNVTAICKTFGENTTENIEEYLGSEVVVEVTKIGEEIIHVNTLSLNKSTLSMKTGESEKLQATINPSNAINKEVIWSSSDMDIATVDYEGTVRAKRPGTVTITVRSRDNSEKVATCEVTITAYDEKIEHDNQDGHEIIYKYIDTTGNNQYDQCRVTISDVSMNQLPEGWKKVETDSETVYTMYKSYTQNAEEYVNVGRLNVKVTVDKIGTGTVPVTNITLNKETLNKKIGEQEKLIVTVEPENAVNKEVKWSSSNISVAEVNEQGVITAKKDGTAVITVSSRENPDKVAICTVNVAAYNEKVEEDNQEGHVITYKYMDTTGDNQYDKCKVTISGVFTNEAPDTWEKEGENSDTGYTICKYYEENAEETVNLGRENVTIAVDKISEDIQIAVTGVELNKTELNLEIEEEKNLVATVKPENASNKNVTWSTSDESVAEVNQNGLVTAIKEGEATITVTTEDNSYTATCQVAVTDNSTDPDDPNNPGDPDDPNTPGDPDDPNNPGNPDDPNNPGNPDDPNNPGDPDDPNNPGNPDDPNNPGNPDDPNNPGDPDDPNNPGNPDDPNNPGNPNDPNNTRDPERPNGSGNTKNPTNSGSSNQQTEQGKANTQLTNKQSTELSNTTTKTQLPKAGISGVLIIVILTIIGIGTYSYIRYKKLYKI